MKAIREVLAVCGLLFAIAMVVLHYAGLPERIPTHFDVAGVANGWGDKSMLWILVGIASLVYVSLTLIRFVPTRFLNVPVSAERRAAAIPIAFEMVEWIKAEIAWLFAAIVWSMVAVAEGRSQGLTAEFTPVALVVIFGTVGFYLRRIFALKASSTH